jgi:hypothetical protein
MISHRTTARGTLVLAVTLLTLVGGAGAAVPQKIVFPVLGSTTYTDDFGDPRADGPPHQGIDIIATKRSLALAAEAGKVEFWTHSASAGCMLYLHGASGTDYYYIHLNNDLTPKNDNRGKCVAGTAYAKGLKDGAKVVAGQPVGYVGDSGDANGIHAHLHFELHPGRRKAATDPYLWLQRATHLLFSAPRGMPFTLELRGTVASVKDNAVQLSLAAVNAWPMRQHQTLKRRLLVTVPVDATVQRVPKLGSPGTPTDLSSAKPKQQVDIWTAAAPTTLKAQRGDDLALSASLVSLVSP